MVSGEQMAQTRLMEEAHPGRDQALKARRLGIDTHDEPVVFLHADSHVARSEGLESHTRVQVIAPENSLLATLNVVRSPILLATEIGLSESAWQNLGVEDGEVLHLCHPDPVESFSHVRRKIYGHTLDASQFQAIIADISAGRYSNVQVAAFITTCANANLAEEEIVHLTRAMVGAGPTLDWDQTLVADKHCIGGLPGNRTTPLIVAIGACHGITIPKTSSRAITSPAGTADCMETMTRVDLDLTQMRDVVEREGACLAWGGSVSLSPADDLLIKVERSLDIDSEGQLIASVLSKKLAAGSDRVLIDIPVGATAKVRSEEAFETLSQQMLRVAQAIGLSVHLHRSDGSQPIGRGIGPALEAHDLLEVLSNDPHAPVLLKEKSITLAGILLEMCQVTDQGEDLARQTLESGQAMEKFMAICKAQGGFRNPPKAPRSTDIQAASSGRLVAFDNRRLARLAKLAGAPAGKAAGITLHAKLGDQLELGQPLLTLHAHSTGELSYALNYYHSQSGILVLDEGR
jgi:thymidine phosphorylase